MKYCIKAPNTCKRGKVRKETWFTTECFYSEFQCLISWRNKIKVQPYTIPIINYSTYCRSCKKLYFGILKKHLFLQIVEFNLNFKIKETCNFCLYTFFYILRIPNVDTYRADTKCRCYGLVTHVKNCCNLILIFTRDSKLTITYRHSMATVGYGLG